jgi:hypothetical protein
MEMTLVLFYAEQLRALIIDSIRTPDPVKMAHSTSIPGRRPAATRRPLQKALALLVADAIFKEFERE